MKQVNKKLKIELSKKQYKTLLLTMYCGEWMLNCHKIKRDKLHLDTEDLEQEIFSFAKEAGVEKWIEYDEKMKMFFPTAEMEEKFHVYIDKFEERVLNRDF